MNRTQILLGVSVVLILGASAAWQFLGRTDELQPSSPVVSEPEAVESNAPALLDIKAVSATSPASHSAARSFAIAEGDIITSWNFMGAYTGKPELIAQAQTEISRLSGLLSTATSSAMILAVGIANQYELMGDGTKQYDYLGRAIQASPDNGLPWHNLGVLMERLGALQTARSAYEQATLVQPQLTVYHYAYLEFLITHMKNDTVTIEKAFAAAEKNVGKRQDFLDLRAAWQAP